MMKMTNTMRHFGVALAVCFAAGALHRGIEALDPGAVISLWWWMVIGSALVLLNVEINQGRNGGAGYWRERWLDSVMDWALGMVGVAMGLLPWWLNWARW